MQILHTECIAKCIAYVLLLFCVSRLLNLLKITLYTANCVVPENIHTHLPSQGWSLEIPRGRGVSKAKIFKGKYEAELKIPGGWECPNQKTILWGGMDIFWNHMYTLLIKIFL